MSFASILSRVVFGIFRQKSDGHRRSEPAAGVGGCAEALEPRTLLSTAVFLPPVIYPVARVPLATTIADFNGDGHPDIATAIAGEDRVAVLLNHGNGTFALPLYVHVPFPRAVAAADFNGDGHIDLAVSSSTFDFTNTGTVDINGQPIPTVNNGSTLEIFYGNGNGTFSTKPVKYPLFGGGRDLVAADVNGDGHPDIIFAAGNRIAVLLNNGDGTFAKPVYYNTGNDHPTALAVADFNGDGLPDIAVARGQFDSVSILLNNKNAPGTFAPAAFYPAGSNPQGLTVGDFNGDGKLDLALVDSGFRVPAVSVLLGNGDGSFRPPVSYGGIRFSDGITSADYTGSGVTDLVVASFDGPLQLYPGNGDGTFSAPVPIHGATFGQFVKTADFNGDGRPDLAVTPFAGFKILLNSGQTVPTPTPGGPFDHTIDGGAARSFQFYTTDGTLARVSLLGPGSATLHFSGSIPITRAGQAVANTTALELASIVTTGTNGATTLSITSGGGSNGSGVVAFASITADAPIGAIDAPGAGLTGNLTLPGGARRVSLLSANNGTILISGGQVDSLELGQTAGETITSAVSISRISVKLDAAVMLTAPAIGSFAVGGGLHDSILNLTAPHSAAGFDLGNLSSVRQMTNVSIHSAGNIGRISSFDMINSAIYAGVAPLPAGGSLPAVPGDFAAPATLGAMNIGRPAQAASFANSVIAAYIIGKANLGRIQTANGGNAFGLAAHFIASVTGADLTHARRFHLAKLTSAAQVAGQVAAEKVSLQDFQIRIL